MLDEKIFVLLAPWSFLEFRADQMADSRRRRKWQKEVIEKARGKKP